MHSTSLRTPFDESRPASFRARPLTLLIRWLRVNRLRQELLALDDEQLKDVGISRAQAAQEAAKRFWE